jgi:hypothetical protein
MEEITGAAVPKSLMENLLGLLRVRIKRGVNLAVRDVRSSDPYLVLKMYNQVIFIFLHHFPNFSSSSQKIKNPIFFLIFIDPLF